MKKNYEILEHTADLYIRVRGADIVQLFQNSAAAMFGLFARKKSRMAAGESRTIVLSASSRDELYIYWLNELLSESASDGVVFTGFDISTLTDTRIEAVCTAVSKDAFRIHTEIKAATYHGLKIVQSRGRWIAEVIFDV